MDNPSTQRIPTNRLPALQRPTPSRPIRVHLDTHARLARCKRPGESFNALVLRLLSEQNARDDSPGRNGAET